MCELIGALCGAIPAARHQRSKFGCMSIHQPFNVLALYNVQERHREKEIRVAQYGLGPIGSSIVRLMRQKDSLEIVGAIDEDPAKAGRDLGEVVGAADAPWGVPVSADAKTVLEKPLDVIVHSTSSYLTSVMEQLLECIAAGCCIVSTCEELAYPFRKHPELSQKLDAAAKEEGVALVGTGVNPGFVMDKLALTLSAVAQRIDWLSAVRIVDASKRRLPLQKKIGAGMTPEEFRAQVAAGVIKHHGLPESIAMVADGLGFALDDISETIEPVIAEEIIKTEFLEVAPGQVAGVHQIARGVSSGKEKIFMELKMYVGARHPADTVVLKGEPHLTLTIPGGTHGDVATAAVVVNSIPAILAANAGLRTSRDLRATAIPSVAVPLSIMGTFGVMYLLHYSIDNLSLMALTISTGFVVDDAIVVTENIARYIERGEPPMKAALKGRSRSASRSSRSRCRSSRSSSRSSSWAGSSARLFREFAVTLGMAVALSALVSLTLTPMMARASCARTRRVVDRSQGRGGFDGMLRQYDRALGLGASPPGTHAARDVGAVAAHGLLFAIVPKGLFPQQDTGRLSGSPRRRRTSRSRG